ncbi:cytidine/deoxycytidylate deaminase family protein [Patescibacteria group bacterium]|nr:cytidine/deoxycytidylate deaminase family protein [Patescibacteria group bacterium]
MPKTNKIFRPSWDDYFMAITRIVATRSTCDRLHAGAVLVQNNRIIATGYNGSPPRLPHCDDVGHLLEEGHCVRTVHAEHNVLLQAAVLGSLSTKDSTMYTKYSPCIHCSKYIAVCGIRRVVIGKIYRNDKAVNYLREAGIDVDIYPENKEWNGAMSKLFKEEIEEKIAAEGKVKIRTKQ